MIPEAIREEAYEKYGKTPEGAAEAFYLFNKEILDAVYDLIPAVKPQVAMYEMYGVPGLAAYIKTIAYAREKGLIVIGDIKRSDMRVYGAGVCGWTYWRGASGGREVRDLSRGFRNAQSVSGRGIH